MRFLSCLLIAALLIPSGAWAHCETCPTDDGGGVIVVSEPAPTYYYDTGRSAGSEAAAALLGLVVVGAVVLYFAQFHAPRVVMMPSQNYAPPMPQYQYQPYQQQQYYSNNSYDSYGGASRGNYGGYYQQQVAPAYYPSPSYGYSRGGNPCPPTYYRRR